jgi:FkbM family methyltransferase
MRTSGAHPVGRSPRCQSSSGALSTQLADLQRLGRKGFRRAFAAVGVDVHTQSGKQRQRAGEELRTLAWIGNLGVGTLIDVGANVGDFAALVLRVVPGLALYAFEPIHGCCELLHRRLDETCDLEVFECALADRDGQEEFNVSEHAPSSSLLKTADTHRQLYPFAHEHQRQVVQVRRLDDFEDRIHIRGRLLIKLDVQGAEARVIAGGNRIFSKAAAVITEVSFLELYQGQALFRDVHALLTDLGFVCFGQLQQIRRPADQLPVFADAIYIREKDVAALM